MAVRKRKPTSPGRRFQTVSDFSDITTDTPEKSLLAPKPKTGGRNNHGRKPSRHRGGGHKQQCRGRDHFAEQTLDRGRVVVVRRHFAPGIGHADEFAAHWGSAKQELQKAIGHGPPDLQPMRLRAPL